MLLAKLPAAWERTFRITEAAQQPLRDTPSPSVRFTWITTWAAKGRVEYGLTPALGQSAEESVAAQSHRVVLTDLQPKTRYHYRIVCTKPDGTSVSTAVKSVVSTASPLRGGAKRERVGLEVVRAEYRLSLIHI